MRILTTIILFFAGVCFELAFGQVSFDFNNMDADAPVFDSAGNRLSGPNYRAMLYGGASRDSLLPAWDNLSGHSMDPLPFLTGEFAGYFYGYLSGLDYVIVPAALCGGGYVWVQVRAWDARLGSSYEAVASLGIGGYGESNVFWAFGGPTCLFPPSPPGKLIGLQSFSLLAVVPEPGTTLLLLLGLPWLFFHRRRNSWP